jgi:hypothetical protein
MHAAQMTPTCSRLSVAAWCAWKECRRSCRSRLPSESFSREAIPTMELPERHAASLFGQPARTTCRYIHRRLTGAHGLLRGYRLVPLSTRSTLSTLSTRSTLSTLSTLSENRRRGGAAHSCSASDGDGSSARWKYLQHHAPTSAPRLAHLSRRGNCPHRLRCDSRASASVPAAAASAQPTSPWQGCVSEGVPKCACTPARHSVRLPLTPSRAHSSPAPGSG